MTYDDWKTTPPELYDKSEYCEECGKPPHRCYCDEKYECERDEREDWHREEGR